MASLCVRYLELADSGDIQLFPKERFEGYARSVRRRSSILSTSAWGASLHMPRVTGRNILATVRQIRHGRWKVFSVYRELDQPSCTIGQNSIDDHHARASRSGIYPQSRSWTR